MSGRRRFLKNVALGIAASLLPKVLRPTTGELEIEEEQVAQIVPKKMISATVYGFYRFNYGDEWGFYNPKKD